MEAKRPRFCERRSTQWQGRWPIRNLAIARAGDHSLHPSWLSHPSQKNFDLFVAYYGDSPGRWKDESDFYDHAKGLKYPWFDRFLASNPWILDYDAVWLADDDLAADTATVADAFEIFHEAGLWLGQPSLTADSVVSYEMMRRNPGALLRHVGFVEEQMPIFSRRCLHQVRHTFGESKSGWGLGIAWAKILGYPKDKMAVIDAAPLRHVRPLQTGEMYTTVLPALGKDPRAELNAIRKRYEDDMRLVAFDRIFMDRSNPRSLERLQRQRR
jgi:hypothetical protein